MPRGRQASEQENSYDNMQLHSAHFRSRICNDERGERSIVKRAHIYNFFGSRDIVEFDKKRLPALSSRLNFGAVAIELIIWAPVNDVEEVNERRTGSETNTSRIRSD